MIVVYIAGPFKEKDSWLTEQNVRKAEEIAWSLTRLKDIVPLCVHSMFRCISDVPDALYWTDVFKELIKRSDVVLCFGQRALESPELAEAKRLNKPIFESFSDLKIWWENNQ